MTAGGPGDPRSAAALVETVARAITYAHRRGVVHCDLKPANVLLTPDGVPKVADFGLATRLGVDRLGVETAGSERLSLVRGTIGYMAPEQLEGGSGQDGLLADVYALGAILYELLTGRMPRSIADYFEHFERGTAAPPEIPTPSRLRPQVPRDLAAICMKCLQTRPDRRYPDAAALADDLGRYLKGEPVHARAVRAWEWAWMWARRRPTAAALITVSTLAALSLLIGCLWYNARLTALARTAERHRVEAEHQAARYRGQLEYSRRSFYALQLTHVERELRNNPGLGLQLLNDKQYCPADLRDFTWGYFLRLGKRKRHDLRLLKLGMVRAVVYSPDGRMLAIGGEYPYPEGPDSRGQVKLADPNNEKLLGTLELDPDDGPVNAIAFSPDGRTLATASGPEPRPATATATATATNPESPRAPAGALILWDLATGTRRLTLKHPDSALLCVVYRSDGQEIASAGLDGIVRFWDPVSGTSRGTLTGHGRAVRALAYAPGGGQIAIGGDDGVIRLHSRTNGRTDRLRNRHVARINALAFSPDGNLLAVGGADRDVTLWELPALRPPRRFGAISPRS